MQSSLVILLGFANIWIVNCKLEAYEGNEPTTNISPYFKITLTQSSTTATPHIYFSENNNNYSDAGTQFHNRSVSWIDFGQDITDTTNVEITLLNGLQFDFQYMPYILPFNYNIKISKISSITIAFNVTGYYKHISLEYNSTSSTLVNSFKNSLLIFVGSLDPIINKTDPNILYFPPGVSSIVGDINKKNGILQFNKQTIFLSRGAWVYGKINVTGSTNNIPNNSPINIFGHGILDGSYFNYEQRNNNPIDHAPAIGVDGNGYSRGFNIQGITCYNPSNWCVTCLSRNSMITAYKTIAWYYNNDGGGCKSYCSFNNSFIRTNDNSFRIHLAKYGYINVENIVFWQLNNGSPFQLGWNGIGCINSVFRNCDIIHAEWTGYNSDSDGNANGAIIGMIQAKNGIYNNLTFDNFRIDTHIGRVIGLDYHDVDNGGEINGLILSNFNIRQSFEYFVKSNPPENFLSIDNCSKTTYMKNIIFKNIIVDGNKIKSNSDWNLRVHGNITKIMYS
eukprot:204640_1